MNRQGNQDQIQHRIIQKKEKKITLHAWQRDRFLLRGYTSNNSVMLHVTEIRAFRWVSGVYFDKWKIYVPHILCITCMRSLAHISSRRNRIHIHNSIKILLSYAPSKNKRDAMWTREKIRKSPLLSATKYCFKIISTLTFHIMITSLVFIKHK